MKTSILAILVIMPLMAKAQYNANHTGVIKNILTYTYNDYIYVILQDMDAVDHQCTVNYFVIPSTVTHERRQILMSRLLTAYSTGKPINLGYDKDGSCVNDRIHIYQVG